MSSTERERFLAGVHVGVLAVDGTGDGAGAGAGAGGAPLAVPIWYAYHPGGLVTVLTGRDSVKTRRIRAAGRFTLCVQQEQPPCRYVSVAGPVVAIEDRIDPDERAALAHRYLPPATARSYLAATAEQLVADVAVRMRPERWLSGDFTAIAEQLQGVVPAASEGVSRPPSGLAGPA
ncbi:pyridoxamine 5'-phosphate oxidase family protein [Kitasatospora misakiensis]